MKTHTTTLQQALQHLMLAGFVLSAGLLPAQKAGKEKQPRTKASSVAAPLGSQSGAQPASPPFVPSPPNAAPIVNAQGGKVDAPLYAVFGEVTVPGIPPRIDSDGKIYVRSYALGNETLKGKTPPSIPGPTFVFQPGDLLRLRFHNYLNRSQNPDLNTFQNNPQETGPGASDDTDEHVSHEISIPNDSNVTNLHVHGLHVDPKQDDVTLLVLPEDNDPGSLTPDLQRFVPTINRWWTRTYQYKLPADHLPGTYWYHSHKHGSTSSQVENGMAGTLIIRPKKEEDDPVPGLWASGHDRVMMIQELANFSTGTIRRPQNKGQGLGQAPNINTPVITLNGAYQPTLKLAPGQIERWRFIVAGANHTVTSNIWVGKITPQIPPKTLEALGNINSQQDANAYTNPNPPKGTKQLYLPAASTFVCSVMPGRVKLIAADGITMWQSRDIKPAAPAFGSAGNRLDMLVQADAAATNTPCRVYQNYPVTVDDLALQYPDYFGPKVDQAAVQARQQVLSTTNLEGGSPAATFQADDKTPLPLANIPTDPFALGTNYQTTANTVNWANVNPDGTVPANPTVNQYPVVPLLRGKAIKTDKGVIKGVEIDDFPQKFEDGAVGWQAVPDAFGGSPSSASILVNLEISGTPDGPTDFPDTKALDAKLSSLSPAGNGSKLSRVDPVSMQLKPGIPSYVDKFDDSDIVGCQVAVFDRGQFTFSYVDKATQQPIEFRQFWINGRQFNVDDWIGNPISGSLINMPVENVEPSLGYYSPATARFAWTNLTKNKELIVTNPGYFTPIKQVAPDTTQNASPVYNYDYTAAKPLTYKTVTGLDAPHTPVSTTAEEWLLINNSDLFHPFHIHINPFFVTEIGQLNYNTTAGTDAPWEIKKITLADKANPKVPFSWVVGNWWDVITIPPHGYVKFRMWINVPTQSPTNHANPDSDLVVHDNANIYGSWVFHCHILRHEDRGMMLMVNTRPKAVDLDGTWKQDDDMITYQLEDNHGGLRIQPTLGTASPNNFTRGTFSRGIGNALYSQPFLGSMTDVTTPGTKIVSSFCVENNPDLPAPNNRLLLSNGHFLYRGNYTPPPSPLQEQSTSLTGTWKDNTGNLANITQTPSTATNAPDDLAFQPVSGVWWAKGSGTWNTKAAAPNGFTATGVLENKASQPDESAQNQLLTFCISQDMKTLVFSNGITWIKTSNQTTK
jgi:FtsP/CotA-like multicopper oxidase with cupredoxin domain